MKIKKLKAEGTEEKIELSKTEGTEYPEGYDPSLPEQKQRGFRK